MASTAGCPHSCIVHTVPVLGLAPVGPALMNDHAPRVWSLPAHVGCSARPVQGAPGQQLSSPVCAPHPCLESPPLPRVPTPCPEPPPLPRAPHPCPESPPPAQSPHPCPEPPPLPRAPLGTLKPKGRSLTRDPDHGHEATAVLAAMAGSRRQVHCHTVDNPRPSPSNPASWGAQPHGLQGLCAPPSTKGAP